jgi:proline racemase
MAQFTHILDAIDVHTAGEPARIVVSGVPPLVGTSMTEKRHYMQAQLDHLRTLVVLEPRGHVDMFGVVVTPPTRADADFGILFLDSAGYLDMCGHSVIGTTTALIETGTVTRPSSPTTPPRGW